MKKYELATIPTNTALAVQKGQLFCPESFRWHFLLKTEKCRIAWPWFYYGSRDVRTVSSRNWLEFGYVYTY